MGVIGVTLAATWWAQPAADLNYWLWFDSVDHGIVCPADRCVSGYRLELWPQGAVGVGAPVYTAIRERWEVEATGSQPAYRLRVAFVPWPSVATGQPYVWTLRALGEYHRNPSPLSAPTPELLIVPPVQPATEVVLQ